jgi:hypothetical protein
LSQPAADSAHVDVELQLLTQFLTRGIRIGRHRRTQLLAQVIGQSALGPGLAVARLQRLPLAQLLANPTRARATGAQHLGDLLGRLALFVQLDNPQSHSLGIWLHAAFRSWFGKRGA